MEDTQEQGLAKEALEQRLKEILTIGSEARRRQALLAELEKRVGKACTNCSAGSMCLDTNGYTYFLRCYHCQYVPLTKYSYNAS